MKTLTRKQLESRKARAVRFKRMVAAGQLEAYRTPGGHLRILAESVEAVRQGRQQGQARPVRDASPVLHNRRERLEELTLEAQELRARRELEKLRREEAEETERREAEAEAREQDAAERQEALALEQARLERERAQEQERREAERELAAFRRRWLETTTELLSAKEVRWLSLAERKQILDAIEAEIAKRQPSDEPRMIQIKDLARLAILRVIFHDVPRNPRGGAARPTLAEDYTEVDAVHKAHLKRSSL